MSEKLGTIQLAPRENPYLGGEGGYGTEEPFSEEIARIVDSEVLRIMDESHDEARRLLTKHRKELDALASELLERESLDEKEILEVTGLPRRRWRTVRSQFRTPTPARRRVTRDEPQGAASGRILRPACGLVADVAANGRLSHAGVAMAESLDPPKRTTERLTRWLLKIRTVEAAGPEAREDWPEQHSCS